MNKGLLVRLLVCVLTLGVFLFLYVDKKIEFMGLRLHIPLVIKELREIQEENTQLQYEIDQFENPSHLMELSRKPEFSSLRHPLLEEVWVVPFEPVTTPCP
jgi:hypothetical protein